MKSKTVRKSPALKGEDIKIDLNDLLETPDENQEIKWGVIQPSKISYLFNTDISSDTVKDFINFINQYASMVGTTELDFYLNTPGGDLYAGHTLRSILENSQFSKINIIVSGEVSSYGFILLYTCKNVNKIILPDSMGVIHRISHKIEDREIRANDYVTKFHTEHLNKANEDFLLLLKENKVLSAKDYNSVEKGIDLYINHNQLIRIMKKCPFGNFISQ